MRVTLSVIKADVGGYVGHSSMHQGLIERAAEVLGEARDRGLIYDFRVLNVGDDLELVMTHGRDVDSPEVHALAWQAFEAATAVAKSLKLYGAGQDLLSDAFSGNVRGLGPGCAELSFEERRSEPVIVFMADKTSAGSAFNLPLYRIFADPFNTAGLVISEALNSGFDFEVHDVIEHKKVVFSCPEELYTLLAFIGSPLRYAVKAVYSRGTGEVAAVSSTERLSLIAGRYVGKDDPVLIVRAQGEFPAVGEILEAFSHPHLVEGWMRGSHYGPLMPVGFGDARCTRFDGPPRLVAAGFQVADGKLIGPVDLFGDPAFERARELALVVADYLRRHGPFEPHRLPMEEMEYTTLPRLMHKLKDRWLPIDTPVPTGD
jgi:fructose 1,6-bisphosphate aldolase/phosphatase